MDAAADPATRIVVLGQLASPWGVKGWIRVHSYTDPVEALLGYALWRVARADGGWDEVRVTEGRVHGSRGDVVVALAGVTSPEDARRYTGRAVGLRRSELPEPAPGEYYWDDLVGCRVETTGGRALGVVSHFLEFPVNPVMVVKPDEGPEVWVPLVPRHLKRVDLAARRLEVDWDPEE